MGSEYFRESIRREIRLARERFTGQALSQELGRIQNRLDTVDLLSPDIVVNLLLSYRDVQVCGVGGGVSVCVWMQHSKSGWLGPLENCCMHINVFVTKP